MKHRNCGVLWLRCPAVVCVRARSALAYLWLESNAVWALGVLFLCPCSQVCTEIWEVKDLGVRRWKGDIVQYKEHLKQTHSALHDRKDMA